MNEEKYILKLYLAGISPENQKLIIDFKETLKGTFKDSYTLEVIDVLENPETAVDDKILATPTLVKTLPEPLQKLILDLNDVEGVLVGLDMIKQHGK